MEVQQFELVIMVVKNGGKHVSYLKNVGTTTSTVMNGSTTGSTVIYMMVLLVQMKDGTTGPTVQQ